MTDQITNFPHLFPREVTLHIARMSGERTIKSVEFSACKFDFHHLGSSNEIAIVDMIERQIATAIISFTFSLRYM